MRLPYKVLGYYDDENHEEMVDSEGWLHTGDMGQVDEQGNFYFVERIKDQILYLGHTISPSEIESTIQEVTGLSQICVVGIEDLLNGNELPAVVVVKPDSCNLNEEDVVRLTNEMLPDYMRLDGGCYFVNQLSLTPSGKVNRREAKRIATKLFLSRTNL